MSKDCMVLSEKIIEKHRKSDYIIIKVVVLVMDSVSSVSYG